MTKPIIKPPYRSQHFIYNNMFEDYVSTSLVAMEMITWYLFDTQHATERTNRLSFFQHTEWAGLPCVDGIHQVRNEDTNMIFPGMLPNPMAFLIEGIRVFGLTKYSEKSRFKLTIGNKIYADYQSRFLAVKENLLFKDSGGMIPFYIAPLTHFRVDIVLPGHQSFIEGDNEITVVFKGKLARSVC